MPFKDIHYLSNCLHFRGDIPCRPHKDFGFHCDNCGFYKESKGKILIIKLGAIGDVIRTTPLLHRIWKEYPNHEIWWLTLSPAILPKSVNKILPFNLESIVTLQSVEFDILYSLDKDLYACSLANQIIAKEKFGFHMVNGKPAPINDLAKHKFYTGLFDDLSKSNDQSYLEEMFNICGWEFQKEEYILEKNNSFEFNIENNGKKIIGLNTGCGDRWVSRLWSNDNWIKLIKLLIEKDYYPLLLGGKQEDEKNQYLAKETGAGYLGHFSLEQFISLVDKCDAVVTAVTMGMHLSIGLHKPTILFNNIFNPKEFELYGRGEIVMPSKECKCYFSPKCKNKEYFCMDHIEPERVLEAINNCF
jgi:ADP-heptose:LPS heptosyltransferase